MNSRIPIDDPGQHKDSGSNAFLSAGFRPFFLFAGIYGVVAIFSWVSAYLGNGNTPGEFAPAYWHGHEMIFGFVVAAATGFLLTAVPNWTRTLPFNGMPLALLALIWFSGRLAMWFGWSLGPLFVALVDLLMIPALGVYIGRRLVTHQVKRNYIVLAILFVLFSANLMMHLEAMDVLPDSADFGLKLGIYGVVFLVTMISGRVIPGFTANALRRRGIEANTETPASVTRAVVLCLILTFLFDLFGGDGNVARTITGLFAASAAIALLIRMRRWKTLMVLDDPIVWILHAGHFWLVVGLVLLAAANFSDNLARAAALHALTAGAMGTMIIGMMTRAALGHSGREIKASGAINAAYYLIISGAVLRVAAALTQAQLAGDSHSYLIAIAGLLWAGGFAVFTVVFWPVLTRKRL